MAVHIDLELSKEIYDTLRQDATLQGLIGNPARVWDESVPDETTFPYVTFDLEYQDFGAHTLDGFSGTVQINTFVEGQSKFAMKQIMNRIYTLLHDVDLAISGFPSLSLRERLRKDMIDTDNRLYQGVQLFDFIFSGNET